MLDDINRLLERHKKTPKSRYEIEQRAAALKDLDSHLTSVLQTNSSLFEHNHQIKESVQLLKTQQEQIISDFRKLADEVEKNQNFMDKVSEESNQIKDEIEQMNTAQLVEKPVLLNSLSYATLIFVVIQDEGKISIPTEQLKKFRTTPYGYEFGVQVSSRKCRGKSFLSVYLTLYQTLYDDILIYPVDLPICIVLMDQTNQQKHIAQYFSCQTYCQAFSRPISAHNESCAIKKFAPLSIFNGPENSYVRDGKIFINVFVDFLRDGQLPFNINNKIKLIQDDSSSPTEMMED